MFDDQEFEPFNSDAAQAALSILIADLSQDEPATLRDALGRIAVEYAHVPEGHVMAQGVARLQQLAGLHFAALQAETSQPPVTRDELVEVIAANAGLTWLIVQLGMAERIWQAAKQMYAMHSPETFQSQIALSVMDALAPYAKTEARNSEDLMRQRKRIERLTKLRDALMELTNAD